MGEPIYKGDILSPEERAEILTKPQPEPIVFIWKDESEKVNLFTCRVTAAISLYVVALPNHPWSSCVVYGVSRKRVAVLHSNMATKVDAQTMCEASIVAMEARA